MIKIMTLSLLISSVSASAFVYCPSEVRCEETGNIESCSFEQDPHGHWGALSDTQYISSVVPGVYPVSYVSVSNSMTKDVNVICVYTKVEPTQYRMLSLQTQPGAMIDKYEEAGTHWRAEESWWECAPKPVGACPLIEMY